jgi:hypothetical protein
MVSVTRMRTHLPLIVFVLLVLIAVMLVGVACACITDHPMQAIEQALSAIVVATALIAAWPVFAVGLFGVALTIRLSRAARDRASPALLQRFLL